MREKKQVVAAVAAVLCLAVIVLCVWLFPFNTYTQSDFFAMDTFITQQLYGKGSKEAASKAEEQIHALDVQLSSFNTQSQLYKLNHTASSQPVTVDPELFTLLKRSVDFCASSGGLFDITIKPVMDIWDITGTHPQVPSSQQLSQALYLVDYSQIVLDSSANSVFFQKPGMAIDLGALAKGYALDQVRQIYQSHNITAGFISLGGNVLVMGHKPNGESFTFGVCDPAKPEEYLGTLQLDDCIISTSGSYERFFTQDGKSYSHIFDARTAMPVDNDLLAVVAVCKEGLYADFLSTSFFIAGKEKALQNLEQDDFSLLVIDKDNNIYLSSALKPYFALQNTSQYHLG